MGIKGSVVPQHAPGDAGELVSERRRQLVAMQARLCRLQPCSEAEPLPGLRTHEDDVGRLDEERAQILAAALGDAPEDRLATGAVLPGHETQPRAKVTAAFEGLARAYRRDHGRGDDRPNARDAHQALAVRLLVADLHDLAGERLAAFGQPPPVRVA